MARNSSSYIATPPGATIKEQLNDRGMSQKEFALRMDMSEKHISKLINGEVILTPDMAIRLEMVLGVPAKFWNNLDAIYREKLIKIEKEKAMDEDIKIANLFPYSEMAKYGWVSNTKDNHEKVINLRKFFEVVELGLLDNEKITRIVCRRLEISQKSDLALMAWAQQVKIEARDINTAPINIKGLISVIPKIRKMTTLKPEEFSVKLMRLLANCGIALVFLPHLKGSFLQDASFIDGNKIVIGLTARGKDADKFWFSLFHELAHIVLGHMEQHNGTTKKDEEEAYKWARDILIPYDDFKLFTKENDFTKKSVIRFAEKEGIAPGIVVGRLQQENLIKYNSLNDLKEKYEIVVM